MTQHTASGAPFAPSSQQVAQQVVLQGIDHGYVARPARHAGPGRRRFALWTWSPREIVRRGGTVTRDDERAYRDLQAAHDRAEEE